jgi:sugar phosphate isomerase/epimerase
MLPPTFVSRRKFIAALAGVAAATAPRRLFAQDAARSPFPLIGFTKPFQDIGFERTADVAAEVGWSGIECPVRAKGQVLPERVEEDLPRLHEALKKRGLDLTLITTDIRRPDALAGRVLRTARALGVRRCRITFFHYDLAQPIPPQLASLKAELRELAALNRELGLQGGIQNHSGRSYIGAPVWDLHELVRDIDPAHLGICFDIGHATLEGGTSWPIEARLTEPFFACVYVKDFAWKKGPRGWAAEWGPLGDGMVRPEFFSWLKTTRYAGPISLHCEYLKGAGPKEIAQMKKDLAVLKEWLAA